MLKLRNKMRETIGRLDRRLNRARPGSVLIMSVVLLVLLALLGTAYLITAKNDRAATRLYEHNVQIDMLVQGVENMAIAAINNSAAYMTTPSQRFDDWISDGSNGTVDHTWLAARYPGLLGPTTGMPAGSPSETLGSVPSGTPIYPIPNGIMYNGPSGWTINGKTVTPGAGFGATTPVWPAVSAPLVVNANFEDPRGSGAANPSGVRTYVAPAFVSVNGTNYPGLTYAQGGVIQTAMAASASGDGIADAFLWRLPIGTIDGITYYAAVRIIDNNSQININTANSSSYDYLSTGQSESPADGYAAGMFKAHIGLAELTNSFIGGSVTTASSVPEIAARNQYLFGGAVPQGINGGAGSPTSDSGNPVGGTFAYRNMGDAMQNIIGRRLDNPGYAGAGTQAQVLGWTEAALLAYRYDLRNSAASPGQAESLLSASLWNSNAGYLPSAPWDPSQVSAWYSQFSDTLIPANSTPKNRRPYFTTRNPVSNLMPAHTLDAPTTGLPPAGLTCIGKYMATAAQAGSNPVYAKCSINTADVTLADSITFGTPSKTPTLWLGFYNAMLDANKVVNGINNPTGASMFRSPLRDASGTYSMTGPETMLLRSLLAAANAKDCRDSGDNVTVASVGGFPAVINGQQSTVTMNAFGTERQVFITEVYASTEFVAPPVVGLAGTTVNANAGKTNPKGYVAVELYNPYDYPMDMTNWTLAVVTRTPGKPLAVAPINGFLGFGNDGQSAVVPPKGYLVLENIPTATAAAANPATDAQYRPYASYASATSPTNTYYVPNLTQVISDPNNPAQPGGELMVLRQPYAKGTLGYNVQNLPTPFPTGILAGMAPADSFDFTGMTATAGANLPVTEIHYVRANQGNIKALETTQGWKWGWRFVYPGRWSASAYGNYRQEGIEVSTYTPPVATAMPQAPGTYSAWSDAAPKGTTNAVSTPIALGAPDPNPSYINNFPPIQLNNTDFGGPSKCFATPFLFPYGGFARVGDVLQVPYIGGYTILDAQGQNVLEMNPVTRDCANADDLDGGTDDAIEQVGRFCPLLATQQTANNIETILPVGSYDAYAWASHVFDYFCVLDNPNDDYLPNMDPNDFAYGPWSMAAENYGTGSNGQPNSPTNPFATATPVGQTANGGKGPNAGNEDLIGVDGLININTASWRVLAAIPWIPTTPNGSLVNNGKIAQAVLQYRNTYGPFKSLFDLNRVVIGATTLQNYAGNPAVVDDGPSVGDISPNAGESLPSGFTTDYVTNDFETRFNMMNRASNCITLRSDTFTVYVLVQGWSGVGSANPQLVVQRRAAFIEDRTPLSPTSHTPNITQVQSN